MKLAGRGRIGTGRSSSDSIAGMTASSDRQVRHRALVTATMRGPGLEKLRRLADVVYEPWTEQQPLKVYDGPALADLAPAALRLAALRLPPVSARVST